MTRRKLAAALVSAGVATAWLGTTLLPAEAALRTFQVKLVTGQTITVTLDLPPGVQPSPGQIPGVNVGIVSITEVTPPPSSSPGVEIQPQPQLPQPPKPAPEPEPEPEPDPEPTQTQPQQRPDRERPSEPAAAVGDGGAQPGAVAGTPEPPVAGTGQAQATTGKARRGPSRAEDAERRSERERDRRRETPLREPDGEPALTNPGLSVATPGPAPIGVPNFFIDKFRIPPFLLPIYQAAGMEYGIRWEILAAINEIETDYGRNLNVSSAGAVGWMQFMPATWRAYGVDANGDGRKDPYNPVDAIFSAANYLKASGAQEDLRRAIFAYNHADWYVDSVLMRARLIGGMPLDLVGSLTGLTQGRFPINAKARYADAVTARQASRRVKPGSNAAVPVESRADRRAILIFAEAGSAAVATHDGRVVRRGTDERLGRYIQIRDAHGNTYTYGRLAELERRYPVPKRGAKPETPAVGADAGLEQRVVEPEAGEPGVKERLFAQPQRPNSYRAGGDEQIVTGQGRAGYVDELLGLRPDQVTWKRLEPGARVVAGTILGRIGRTRSTRAPHALFEIRPAGRGAPRIDPKPILDGWKLLESTAIYRAHGKNPLAGDDAAAPTIGQILLMGKDELQRRVLANPRIELTADGRQDIRSGHVDRRVLALLEYLAANGLKPTVSSLYRPGSITVSGNVSHHATGTAVDIAAINGIPIIGHQGEGSITDIAIRRLLSLQGAMRPDQIISLMEYGNADNTIAMSDHHDHIHVGFRPVGDSRSGNVLNAVLKPGQWFKVIDRLNEIENPVVRTKPSKAAIKVKSVRPNARARARAARRAGSSR